ncbi:coenzyme F390 synthetase-like protein [Geobacter metallireducens RCH3]|uniref:Adenylyltransferase, putative n=1 Tax=Geobacter metallireducens (strain ATCC 53774 / DSM 7210 / GS-15) TaxID=269799 RepID=Q39UP5_GEOMG|nr:AMP-binding protein [Geobacter metallireducens]ABB32029.1 adenylyltransferase, putative [Geobacter metallireducens GS-15]EHP88785.1 coenzyme F390 synthetase-like protein [Geobacter metallireducens RCH3]
MNRTPLEGWIRDKLLLPGTQALTRSDLEAYQVRKLREVVAYARTKSPFYRNLLAEIDGRDVKDLQAFSRLPFTTPDDVRTQGMRMLCASQDEIERVVTLQTSGTSGEAKRIFFTAEDLELTVDFFHHGMATMVAAGATVIIFLPGERPDSVGDLLARGLARLGVRPVAFGPVRDPIAARAEILRHPSPCLVGIPTQILSLARGEGGEAIPRGWVESVLLSTDYVPTAIVEELKQHWGCRVFTHYGMTETGLGGGVECEARDGYHLREADLYTEIVDPATGRPVADGEFGEVIFTTLTRSGMPLVRYRTGDMARMMPESCPCGTVLKRLGRVQGRIGATVRLRDGASIAMATLDEALLPIPGLLNFTAEIADNGGRDQLNLCLQACEGQEEQVARGAVAALVRAESSDPLFRQGGLTLGSITFDRAGWFTTGTGKRQIRDVRQENQGAVSA